MYTITYNFRDPFYNKEHSGLYLTDSLADVGAFYDMIKRYGGTCNCSV
jgi:hypothetical protein